jgi:hypothetical protein
MRLVRQCSLVAKTLADKPPVAPFIEKAEETVGTIGKENN